jgi:hypothetical protein
MSGGHFNYKQHSLLSGDDGEDSFHKRLQAQLGEQK